MGGEARETGEHLDALDGQWYNEAENERLESLRQTVKNPLRADFFPAKG